MSRRRKTNTTQTYRNKAEKQGRCKGNKSTYIPGIFTYEIPSKGKTARILGQTTGRVQHFLSQHEKFFFLILDYDPLVTDIKEQYLLPLEDTLLVAAELGLKHPYADRVPAVMSTDFYYCKEGQWYAVAIKTTADLEKKSVQDKLLIEETIWKKRGIPWRVVTEKDIPRQLATNLLWLHSGESITNLIPDKERLEHISDAFLELYANEAIPFAEIIDNMESFCGLKHGTVIQLFKQLLIDRKITLDLSKPLDLDNPRKSA